MKIKNDRLNREVSMIRSIAVLLTLSLFFMPAVFAAGPPEAMTPELLTTAMDNLLKMKTDAAAEIRKLDRDIDQNNRTIAKAEDIIRQAQAKGNADAERIGRDARDRSLQARKKNEASRIDADRRLQRADEALVTVKDLLARKTADSPPPKVNCEARLKDWRNDPAWRASQDCQCMDRERPPVCVPKGTKMPELREGVYQFNYLLNTLTMTGGSKENTDVYMGTHKTFDEARRACMESARIKALARGELPSEEAQCELASGPPAPQVKTPRPPAELKQGKF
jgi:hypothetical protein